MKNLLKIIGGILIVIIIAGFIGWQYLQTTPQYSIFLAFNAVKAHDYTTFTKYVDINTVVSNVIDNALVASEKEQQAKPKGNEWEQAGEAFAQGLIISMKPSLIQKAKETVQKQVETGTFQKDFKPMNPIEGFFAIKVKQDGKVADVTIPAQDPKNKPLTVKMRQQNGYWQVFDMNLDSSSVGSGEVNSKNQNSLTKRAKFGDRIDIETGWFLSISSPSAYTNYSSYSGPKDGNKFVAIEVTYENTSSQSDSFSTDNLKLKDVDSHVYSANYSGEEPMISSGNLEAKGKVKGYLTFELPQNEQPSSIIYTNSFKDITIVIGQ